LVSVIAIMMLQYVVIHECRSDRGLVRFISTPIWLPHGAVILFGTSCCDLPYCLFLCFLVQFSLSYGFIHLSHFNAWLHYVSDCNIHCNIWIHTKCNLIVYEQLLVYSASWWLHKVKHVVHCHIIKTNKLIIHSNCKWDFDSCCAEMEKQ
jgi:hypothetical protein